MKLIHCNVNTFRYKTEYSVLLNSFFARNVTSTLNGIYSFLSWYVTKYRLKKYTG